MILDIGGEGRHAEAWNLNPRSLRTLGQQRGEAIPRLIQGRGERIPLADGSVGTVIVERTPINSETIAEILRVVNPQGTIVLRHARAHERDPHRLAVQFLKGAIEQRTVMIGRQFLQETVIQLSPAQ